jgi:hypothetical protein
VNPGPAQGRLLPLSKAWLLDLAKVENLAPGLAPASKKAGGESHPLFLLHL